MLPEAFAINGYWLQDVGGGKHAIVYRIANATVLCGTVNSDGTYTVNGGADIEYTDDDDIPTGETWTVNTGLPEVTTGNPITAMTAMAAVIAVTKVIA